MLPLLAAAAIAIPLAANHREVSPEGILNVNVKVHYVTEIDFVGKKDIAIIPNGEARPRYGDPEFWGVTVDHNALFIRPDDDPPPVGGGRSTNIIIKLVDGRRIQVNAQEISLKRGAKPDLKIIAELEDIGDGHRDQYMRVDDHDAQLAVVQTENSLLRKICDTPKVPEPKSTELTLRSPEVETLNGLHFFDYVIDDVKGKGGNIHVVLFHNEQFLFVAVDGLGVPTISARDGKHYVKVDGAWVKNRWELPFIEDGMVQLGKDNSFKFHLRSKK